MQQPPPTDEEIQAQMAQANAGLDPSAQLLHEHESQYLNWHKRLRVPPRGIPPHPLFAYRMVSPNMSADRPELLVCARLCQLSQSKVRYPVNAVRWARDGRRAVTANQHGEFTLWNGVAFNFEGLIAGHTDAVRTLAWSSSGATLLSGDVKGNIKYWESTMTPVNEIVEAHGGQPIRDLVFAPTDAKFASGADDGTVRIWDWERAVEERVLAGHGWDVKAVDWHGKYGLIASGSKDNQVKLWDPRKRTCLVTLYGHKHTVMKVKWNLVDSSLLLTASRDQTLKLYDIRVLKNAMTFKGHNREVTSCTWHPCSSRVFVSGGYDGTLNHWVVGMEEPLHSFQAHDQAIWDMDFHPVGHVLATVSNDHRAKFWSRKVPGDDVEWTEQMRTDFTEAVERRGQKLPDDFWTMLDDSQREARTANVTYGGLGTSLRPNETGGAAPPGRGYDAAGGGHPPPGGAPGSLTATLPPAAKRPRGPGFTDAPPRTGLAVTLASDATRAAARSAGPNGLPPSGMMHPPPQHHRPR